MFTIREIVGLTICLIGIIGIVVDRVSVYGDNKYNKGRNDEYAELTKGCDFDEDLGIKIIYIREA